jgi:hypothetical protein
MATRFSEIVNRGFYLMATVAVATAFTNLALAQQRLTKLSTDPFTNPTSQHKTQVEPDTFSFGTTIVSVFQSGRFFDGGSSDIGFATSANGGVTWSNGFLPGITNVQQSGNPYDRVSDPSVAYDAAHGVWLIASLPIVDAFQNIPAVIVSRSTDGIHWQNPVSVTPPVTSSDKDWIVCDDTPSSRFYGHCYVEWDDFLQGNLILMSTSTDGGLTWGTALSPAGFPSGIGGQPIVQPNGNVIVPMNDAFQSSIVSFRSTDGGLSWSSTVSVASISDHFVAGNLRTSPLPSAEVDPLGNVYVVWQDCRFRPGCSSNDIVMGTSGDGVNWTAPVRVPIDPINSTVDHFIPGIAVDRASPTLAAHIGITFYFYPQTSCDMSTCQLMVGFISSNTGGMTWNPAVTLAGPMNLAWLANTNQGVMVADYISTSYLSGATIRHKAFGVFAVANAPTGNVFDEAMYTPTGGLSVPEIEGLIIPTVQDPVLSTVSDHPPRRSPARIF